MDLKISFFQYFAVAFSCEMSDVKQKLLVPHVLWLEHRPNCDWLGYMAAAVIGISKQSKS